MDQRTGLWSPKRPDLSRSSERTDRLGVRSRLVEGTTTSSRSGTRSALSSRHQQQNLSRGSGVEDLEEDEDDPQWRSSASKRGFVKDFTSEVSPRYMQQSPPRRRSFSDFLEEVDPREGRIRAQQPQYSTKLNDRTTQVRSGSVLNHDLSGPHSRLERFLSRNEHFLESPVRPPSSSSVRRSMKEPVMSESSRFRSNDLASPDRNTRFIDNSSRNGRRANEQQPQRQLSPPRRRIPAEEDGDLLNNNKNKSNKDNNAISPQRPFDATDEIWSSRMMFSSANARLQQQERSESLSGGNRRGPNTDEDGQIRIRVNNPSTGGRAASNVLPRHTEEEGLKGPKSNRLIAPTTNIKSLGSALDRRHAGMDDSVVEEQSKHVQNEPRFKADESPKQPLSSKQQSRRPSLDEVFSAISRTTASRASPQRSAQSRQSNGQVDSPEREKRRQSLLSQQQQQQEKGHEEIVTHPTDYKAYPKDLSPIRDPAFSSPSTTNNQSQAARLIGKTPSPGRPSTADRKLDFSIEPAANVNGSHTHSHHQRQLQHSNSPGAYKALRPSQMLQQQQHQTSSKGDAIKKLNGLVDSAVAQRPSNLVSTKNSSPTTSQIGERPDDDGLDKQKIVEAPNRFERESDRLGEAKSPTKDTDTRSSPAVTRLESATKEMNAARIDRYHQDGSFTHDATAATRSPAKHLHFDDSKHGEEDLDLPTEGKEVAAFSYNMYNAEAFKEPAHNEEIRISDNGQSSSIKVREEKQREIDNLVADSPSLNHSASGTRTRNSSPHGSLSVRKGTDEIAAQGTLLPSENEEHLLLATPKSTSVDQERAMVAVAFSESRLSTASMMTQPNEEDAKRWARVADLLDMSGFDGTEFRKITKSRGGALGAVDRAFQTVLRDFQRQKKLIEKSMEATKREDQERLQFEKALAMKNDLISDLEAKNRTLQQTLARVTEEEKSRRAAAAASATATSASAISDAQRQKRWENRARKMEEEFLRVRDQLESELQLGMETRRKAREEFERLLGKKANPADGRIVQILEGFIQDQLRGLKTQVLPPQSARSSQLGSAEKDALETAVVTARSRDEIRDFAKRVCELVLAHSQQEDMVENADEWGVFSQIQNEDLVDEKGWFPTRVVSKVIPQISRWISQAEEVDRLRFWRDQILAQTNTASEEAALRVLRRKVNE